MEQISKLEDALYKIQFEQHWLEAQADRHAISMIFYSLNRSKTNKAFIKLLFTLVWFSGLVHKYYGG